MFNNYVDVHSQLVYVILMLTNKPRNVKKMCSTNLSFALNARYFYIWTALENNHA